MEALGVTVGQRREPPGAPVDLVVGEKRIVRDVVLRALALHHICRVVQHALDQHVTRLGHDHGCLRLLAEENGQAANVVEVAVGDDDEVEGHAAQRTEVGRRCPPDLFRVQAAIEQELQVAELEVEGIRADAAVAIEID